MAKYLDTSHISSELMELLKEAKEKIILVTYSVQVNTQIQERLKTKSKIGTLSEITLIYGNTKPKKTEMQWMSEVDDLKVWQKKNLHAKCYINEKKAIICSMNLYDYSQTTNVEMGFLITKEEDPIAYEKMMEDINDLKINGEKGKPWLENDNIKNEKTTNPVVQNNKKNSSELSYYQQVKKQILESLRNEMSIQFKRSSSSILSNHNIIEIVSKIDISKSDLKLILKSDKKVKQIGDDILNDLENANGYTIGKVVDTRYQNDDFTYDQIKLLRFDSNSSEWYDTKKELPKNDQIVAVELNKNWFNEYLLLEESNVIDVEAKVSKIDYSGSKYKSTSALSKMIGISSNELFEILENKGWIKKEGKLRILTKDGELNGGQIKNGQYGEYPAWPEEFAETIKVDN